MRMYCATCEVLLSEDVDIRHSLLDLLEGHEDHTVLFTSDPQLVNVKMEMIF